MDTHTALVEQVSFHGIGCDCVLPQTSLMQNWWHIHTHYTQSNTSSLVIGFVGPM